METNAPAAQEQMRQVAQLSRQALAEVHSTVTRLRVPDLEGEVLASSRALETAGIQADLPDATTAANIAGMNSSPVQLGAARDRYQYCEALSRHLRHRATEPHRVRGYRQRHRNW